MSEPVDWRSGAPRSPRFDDIYFSPEDGLAEARAVFLKGCGLPEGWSGRERFVIGELGFGVGLNLLAAVEAWARTRPAPTATLHLFSLEAFPIAVGDAAAALARWPDLTPFTPPLLTGWPRGRRGAHRIEWPELGVFLDLVVGEASEALADWCGAADAWFLDGFAPARNPAMWSPGVMTLVAARSRPGARAATFTVAGDVRRALQGAGFTIEKRPGFGAKRERLEARRPAPAGIAGVSDPRPDRVAVVGAGIAGATLARAFRRLGAQTEVFDQAGVGAGASGNPAALVTPRLDAGLGAAAGLHAEAFARAAALYRSETPEAILAEGAVQLESGPRDAARFDAIAGWDGFDPGAVARLSAKAAAARLDEAPGAAGLFFRDALTLEPASVLARWLGETPRAATIRRLVREGRGWRLLSDDGEPFGPYSIVCLAAGPACRALSPGLDLLPVRGQIGLSAAGWSGAPGSWGGYAIPTREGFLYGATHARGRSDTDVSAADEARNRAALAEGRRRLAAQLGPPLSVRVGLRAATRDHQPLAGRAPGAAADDVAGLFLLTGLGGRGFTLAPLLAEAVAAEALGLPSPLAAPLRAIVDPARRNPTGRLAVDR